MGFFWNLITFHGTPDTAVHLCLCFCPPWHPWPEKKTTLVWSRKKTVLWQAVNSELIILSNENCVKFLSVRYRAPDGRRPPGAADPSALSQRIPGRGLHLPGCLQTGLMSHDPVTLCATTIESAVHIVTFQFALSLLLTALCLFLVFFMANVVTWAKLFITSFSTNKEILFPHERWHHLRDVVPLSATGRKGGQKCDVTVQRGEKSRWGSRKSGWEKRDYF